jgi:hypothetical protein
MTDGYVGNDLEVLDLVQRLRGTSRWFPFGTGNGVNRFLIDGMARLGGGEPYYALLGEPGDSVARTFYDHVSSPVLTDVHVEWQDLDVADMHPDAPADVWAEKPLVIHARYRGAGSGRIVLTGFQHGEPYRQELAVTLPEQEPDHAAIASMWARAKVEALTTQDLGALQSGIFPGPLREQIVSIALAHRIVTPFTSFIAVEERVVNEGGAPRTVGVPVEMPDGVRYEGIFGAGNARDEAAATAGGVGPKFLALRSAGTQPATLAPPEPARDRMPARPRSVARGSLPACCSSSIADPVRRGRRRASTAGCRWRSSWPTHRRPPSATWSARTRHRVGAGSTGAGRRRARSSRGAGRSAGRDARRGSCRRGRFGDAVAAREMRRRWLASRPAGPSRTARRCGGRRRKGPAGCDDGRDVVPPPPPPVGRACCPRRWSGVQRFSWRHARPSSPIV